ncbi:hypothetical protein BDV38DRAFT_246011 [Aspergillus pseudotamarii]|uniref:Uncharacterized protein n=1 Tax=Aspergillus pseudotamarii TaxID=132259 RepID=A0A5N6SVR8_ASPPS|nr:uncharacterized protein BDV38DRAFT_246011 [Aspergillus pseudotamarii]KAE8137987.1 hypothetical protein BDV38DRAFT_246011 [Aspergillus pseudotamarii]
MHHFKQSVYALVQNYCFFLQSEGSVLQTMRKQFTKQAYTELSHKRGTCVRQIKYGSVEVSSRSVTYLFVYILNSFCCTSIPHHVFDFYCYAAGRSG